MADCIFCEIAAGDIPADMLDRDDRVMVIRDINPQAPVHLLVVPLEHITAVADVGEDDAGLLSHMVGRANAAAAREGVAEKGYRLAISCREEGGQTVGHLHMHVLGGRRLSGQLG